MIDKNKIQILHEKIKQYKNIILLCHVLPDHDSVGSTNAMRKFILNNYPGKEIRIYSQTNSFFEYFAPSYIYENLTNFDNPLIICLDCANVERLSSELILGCEVIKIDHHPPLENYGDLNIVDVKYSCTCEMLWVIAKKLNWNFNEEISNLLYLGIIGDTGRFLFKNTSSLTYSCVADLFNYGLNPQKEIYPHLYSTSLSDLSTKSKLIKHLNIYDNFGVLLLGKNTIEKLDLNILDVSKFTNQFGCIQELEIWIVIVKEDNYYKCSIRSKNVVINKIAQNFNGGGHKFASGVKCENKEILEKLIQSLYYELNNKKLNLDNLIW